jgi:drug/metabolite transporter (DMT)-like permease
MFETYAGEISALIASICFSIGPVFNTLAGQKISVGAVNRVRLLVTFISLIFLHFIIFGEPLPSLGFSHQWLYFGISGVFALVLGDTLLFGAFARIGTRLAMLIATLIPVMSAVLAWIFLGENLKTMQVVGISITVIGVGSVLLDFNNRTHPNSMNKNFKFGLLLAFGAAIFHTLGSIFAKAGFSTDFPALSGHIIRITISLFVVMAAALIQGKNTNTIKQLKLNPLSLLFILLGALFGPIVGMWLSLNAIQIIPVGIATALISLPPVWLLPIGRHLFHERIGRRAIVGSLVTVIGVAILLLL